MAETKTTPDYADLADTLAFGTDTLALDRTERQIRMDELTLAKAQVYALLAVRDKLDDVHTMLDTIAARIDALAGQPDTEMFGILDDTGQLRELDGYLLWSMAAYLPEGRESDVAAFLARHGISVYRMWRPS